MIPTRITVHCSATKDLERLPASKIREWHIARGWKDIGYALVIQPDGEVELGRGLNNQGAHVEGENEGNIGICLIGTSRYSPVQLQSLRHQIHSILWAYPTIDPWEIYCHNEFDSAKKQGKTCPGFSGNRLRHWYHTDPSALAPNMIYTRP